MSTNISPVTVEPVVDWIPNNPVDGGSTPTYDELLFFFVFKSRVYKWNNEQLINASLFLFFVDPLLDWNPNSCGDDGATLNLDDFFLFFRRMLFEEKSERT